MIFKRTFQLVSALFCVSFLPLHAQKITHYNLAKALKQHQLDTTSSTQEVQTYVYPQNNAISVKGVLWLRNVDFKEGAIDIDLRGRNVFLQSFLGVAFHAKDTKTYDVVYFCPFRFRDTVSETRKYSVKYMSIPDYSYTRLRKEQPGMYENEVTPTPNADEWFHATILINNGWISVFVNHSATPSLKVKQLNTLPDGKIGLWSYASTLSSDFANLVITKFK